MRTHKKLYDIKKKLNNKYFLEFNSSALDTINYITKNINCSIIYSITYKLYNIIIYKNHEKICSYFNISDNLIYEIIDKYLIKESRKNKLKQII